jgi:hypothetical protein
VKFASENGEDHMSEDLRRLMWNTWAGKHNSVGEALPLLGDKWGQHVKGLRDSLYAIRASQVEKHELRRLATLDRALGDLLENIKTKFREFSAALRMPTMLLFMFGVMMPMVFILFIPIFSIMGFEIGNPTAVTIMLIVILIGIFILAEMILAMRPMSFSPIKIPRDYPGLSSPGMVRLGDKEMALYKFAVLATVLISLLSAPYFLGYKNPLIVQWGTYPLVVGVFVGAWIYFYFDSFERIKVRSLIQAAEEDCIEACFHIGNRLMSGVPAEEALIRVSEMLSSSTKESYLSKVLENTVRNIKYMNMGLKSAFFDRERGSLKDVHSGLISGLFGLFANSMERGVDAAAETLIHSAQHFRDIKKVENSLREALSYTTSMTRFSSTIIAPVLCSP